MVQIRKFEVLLDGNKTDYAPGDTISGHLEIDVIDGSLEFKWILVQLLGKAHCGFGEGRYYHFANEKLCNEIVVIRGEGAPSSDKGPLSQGTHSLPFRFQLASPLASSYADDVGYVRYRLKARIERPLLSTTKTKKEIQVRSVLDLNQMAHLTNPSGGSEERTPCCGCLSGGIESEVSVERMGYVPGDIVVASGKMKNNSSSKVKKTSMEIVKCVTCRTTTRIRKFFYTLTSSEDGPPCAPGKSVNLNNVRLNMPQTVPTSEILRIMKFEYFIVFRGHLRTCTSDARAFASIVVGTVSLRNDPSSAGQVASGSAIQSSAFGFQDSILASSTTGVKQGVTNNAFYSWDQSNFS